MMVQNRYQRRRMYTRIALGKNRAMDVVSGETSGGSGQLLILYPLLFALQILQCWIGASRTDLLHHFSPVHLLQTSLLTSSCRSNEGTLDRSHLHRRLVQSAFTVIARCSWMQ